MHIMSLQTLKDLSRLRKKRRLWPLLYTASILEDHSSLLSSTTPGYLQVWTDSISPPSIQADWHGELDLLKFTSLKFRLFGLGIVREQNVIFGPAIEALHKVPALLLLSTAHTYHNSCIIRILLYVAGLWVVPEVWCVQSEKKRTQNSTLRSLGLGL